MTEAQIIGAIVGGILGFVIAGAIASPKFKYLGGHWGEFKGGMGCLKTLFLQVVLTAIGAGAGAIVATALG